MPPSPTWLQGKAAFVAFLVARPFAAFAQRPLRVVRSGANGQPALVFYADGELHAVHVLTMRGGRILEVHHFCEEKSFRAFGLPPRVEG